MGMISFLKDLSTAERRGLVPEIRKIDAYYNIWENRNGEKERVNNIAKFVCYPPSEGRQIRQWNLPKVEDLDLILPWYCPPGFSEYQFQRSYKYLIKWEQAGYLTLTPEIILTVLPGIIFKPSTKSHREVYTLEFIEEYPVTLDEHIWYFFEAPSNIDWSDKRTVENIKKKDTKGNWCDTFIKYTSEGRIDRMRVLRESLLTANRNFNKTQTGWFIDLFMALEPTTEELLDLQNELFGTLSCVWSKPVNNTMKLLKKLATDPRFRVEELLPALPMLLSSDVKAIVTATLSVLEVILKKESNLQTELCNAMCAAFLSKDEAIQKKAATLFIKYISPGRDASAMLSAYTDNLLMSTRTQLKDYLEDIEENPAIEEDTTVDEYVQLSEENRIHELTSAEDFAFFLSHALDFPEPYYFDHLLNNLILWGNEITEEQLVLLEPAFQKAYKMLLKWDTPAFDEIPQVALTDYGKHLQKKFPGKIPFLEKQQKKLAALDAERSARSEHYRNREVNMSKLSVSAFNTGFHQIAIEAIRRVANQDKLPLLSTPTHRPTWIDPSVLIERLAMYQQQGKEPIDMDMQLALQRCALDNPQTAIEQAKQQLTGEYQALMIFLLDKSARPVEPFTHPLWWMTAAITRMSDQALPEFDQFGYNQIPAEYTSGNHKWDVSIQGYLAYGDYNPKTQSYDRYRSQKPEIRLLTSRCKLKDNRLFYRYLWKADFYSESLKHILLAIPNNPDYLIGRATLSFAECDMWEVPEQNVALSLAGIIYDLKQPFRDMHYFALACFLLAKLKAVQDYGVAIWSENVSADRLDAARLGKAIGHIEALEFFPLKRLTDLMAQGMIGISGRHNNSLIILIESLLAKLGEKPVKNQKKLLEIYSELLALTQNKPNINNIPHWEHWSTEASLKKTIKEIMK